MVRNEAVAKKNKLNKMYNGGSGFDEIGMLRTPAKKGGGDNCKEHTRSKNTRVK